MRWRNVFIMVLVLVVVQAVLHRLVGMGPRRLLPDLLLMTAVVLVLRSMDNDALIVAWLLGFFKDLITEAPLGAYAIAFGLTALLLTWLRELLYRDNTLGMMLVTFLAAVVIEELVLIWSIYQDRISSGNWGSTTTAILLGAVVTAAVAPYGQWLLLKLRYWLGWTQRKRYGGN
ncbi:MAG: rod shape-determining protein MreD [Sedimentisphaerales bacterium]|nr:rod shape-determining protein MreD [Sedimentisphaerales bacterium]